MNNIHAKLSENVRNLAGVRNQGILRCLSRIQRGQKWHRSRGLLLRMCQQARFYVFHQARSFNTQKYIQRHIIGKKWCCLPLYGHQILVFTAEKSSYVMDIPARHVRVIHSQVMHAHVMHAHVKHGHVIHGHSYTPMPCILFFM